MQRGYLRRRSFEEKKTILLLFFLLFKLIFDEENDVMDGDEELELNLELIIYSNGFWHV